MQYFLCIFFFFFTYYEDEGRECVIIVMCEEKDTIKNKENLIFKKNSLK